MHVIGLISGTSVDGIDAALVDVAGSGQQLQVTLLAGATYPYPEALRQQILAVCADAPLSMAELANLDDQIAREFARAAIAIQTGQPPARLIGSHGQTVFHRPPGSEVSWPHPDGRPLKALGYSLQLGRGEVIAHLTGITTISNFRGADIAVGGEGAPLVPAIDAALLRHPRLNRCVQNIGGIGNVAYLEAGAMDYSGPTLGWDTGPGNVLIDLAVQHFSGGTQTYDRNGSWAATGTPCQALVEQWLEQDFFWQAPPKSTGRELFSEAYLNRCLEDAAAYDLSPEDMLATLTELTATSINHSYRQFLPRLPDQVLLCGGGSKNLYLRQRLQQQLPKTTVLTTDEVGLSSDFKEAIAFAVLAYWRQQNVPGNLPQVTGATRAVLLGEVHQGSEIGA